MTFTDEDWVYDAEQDVWRLRVENQPDPFPEPKPEPTEMSDEFVDMLVRLGKGDEDDE